jgi:hypothetical protein
MSIAYLILAHHQPEHLARLVRALRFDGHGLLRTSTATACGRLLDQLEALLPNP